MENATKKTTNTIFDNVLTAVMHEKSLQIMTHTEDPRHS
jgi:hypothetical protein